MIRVFAIDDHEIMRKGLEMVFEKTPDIRMTGQAGSWEEALDVLDPKSHDVVLLDISLPGPDGLTILKNIKTRFPALSVLILSVHPEEVYGVPALRGGAAGYVHKGSGTDTLIEAIRRAARGKLYVSDTLAQILALDKRAESGHSGLLSDREIQVLRRIAAGKSIKEIAAELDISIKTVSTYKTRILLKTNRKSVAELVRYSVETGLVE